MRHPDEGVIQGWVEAQLPAGEAAEVASHVAGCAECQALVAEIRGLMARSAGIVAALDGAASAGVRPLGPAAVDATRVTPTVARPAAGSAPGPRRQRATWRRWAPALAAAVVVLAVMRQASTDDAGRARVREALQGERGASAPVSQAPARVVAPSAAPAPASAPVPMPIPAPRVPSAGSSSAGAIGAASERERSSKAAGKGVASAASDAAPGGRAAQAARTAPTAQAAPAAPVPADMSAPAPPPSAPPAPMPAPGLPASSAEVSPPPAASARALRADAAMRAAVAAPASGVANEAINQAPTGCYRVISQDFSRIVLEASGAGSVVGGDSLAARWRVRGDSVEVRWDDALAVFPRGVARTVGRLELRGESRPFTVWRGCPGR